MLTHRKAIIYFFSVTILLAGIFFSIKKVVAVDYIKSIEGFVMSYENQINSPVSNQFTIYIGDNISGVSNPIKSIYFIASGVYTGGAGTITFNIDGDPATSKAFNLPAVTKPTPFEIIYKDKSDKINPATAGEYSYTMNVAPSGISISGLSVISNATYRYIPGSCPDGQPTDEKIKSTESHVYDSSSQISSNTDAPFNLYIGDNIAGITDPIKDIYFTISGVYTSSGASSLQLQIDNTSSSTQTFNLPNVGANPTSFEIIYKDKKGIMNHSTAGNYSHTLNIVPGNINISGLGIILTSTYRYKPPTCGAGFPPYGDLVSQTFDTSSDGAAYNSIMWKGLLGGPLNDTGKVKFQFATSDCANGATDAPTCSTGGWGSGASDYIGGALCNNADFYDATTPNAPVEIECAGANHNNKKYYRYKIRICSANDCSTSGDYTPTINDVIISWGP